MSYTEHIAHTPCECPVALVPSPPLVSCTVCLSVYLFVSLFRSLYAPMATIARSLFYWTCCCAGCSFLWVLVLVLMLHPLGQVHFGAATTFRGRLKFLSLFIFIKYSCTLLSATWYGCVFYMCVRVCVLCECLMVYAPVKPLEV